MEPRSVQDRGGRSAVSRMRQNSAPNTAFEVSTGPEDSTKGYVKPVPNPAEAACAGRHKRRAGFLVQQPVDIGCRMNEGGACRDSSGRMGSNAAVVLTSYWRNPSTCEEAVKSGAKIVCEAMFCFAPADRYVSFQQAISMNAGLTVDGLGPPHAHSSASLVVRCPTELARRASVKLVDLPLARDPHSPGPCLLALGSPPQGFEPMYQA